MLNYNPQGLIPAIIQDDETDAVLMLGYISPETLQMTKEKGQVVFWSRSRKEIWHKGATSGDYLEVRSIKADCEDNSLLIRVKMLGGAVCHTGARVVLLQGGRGVGRGVGGAAFGGWARTSPPSPLSPPRRGGGGGVCR